MVEAHLNYFDMVVIGIMFLSCLFAFFRGFVREILSLAAWIGAGVVTITYFPSLAETLKPNFTKPMATAIAATAILYVGSLVVFAIFNHFLIKILKSSTGVGFFDNLLGLAFGGLRGAFIISLGYFMLSLAIPENKRPDWLAQAQTREYAESGAVMLTKLAPDYLNKFANLQNGAVKSINDAKDEEIKSKVAEIMQGGDINQQNISGDQQVKIIRGDVPPTEKPKSFDEILNSIKQQQ